MQFRDRQRLAPRARLRHVAALCVLFCLSTGVPVTHAQSIPWAEVGDPQLRRDVELLAAEGVLQGPLLSWPLSFAELTRLDDTRAGLAPHVRHAMRRVRQAAGAHSAPLRVAARTQLTTAPRLVRDFAESARNPIDLRAEAAWVPAHGFVRAGGSVRAAQTASDVRPDRTLAAAFWDDLHFYAGYVEHFWGPGQDGSLILSNAARPFPKVGIRRMGSEPFAPRWLRWIGRFRGEVFVGMLDEQREHDRPLLVGMRLELQPVQHWEIGLSRTIQLCGRGRPCDSATWGRALIGVGDMDNTGTKAEPGNQLAAIETRVMASALGTAFSLYGQVLAEDEGTVMIYRFSQLWGALATRGLGARGAMGTLGFEFTDTRTRDYLMGGSRRPNTTYHHHIYTDGYTYRGVPLGFSLGGDARLVTLRSEATDSEDRRYWAIVRAAELNGYDTPTHPVSASKERLWLLELGVELPVQQGVLRLEARGQTDAPDSPGRERLTGQLEAGYRLTL